MFLFTAARKAREDGGLENRRAAQSPVYGELPQLANELWNSGSYRVSLGNMPAQIPGSGLTQGGSETVAPSTEAAGSTQPSLRELEELVARFQQARDWNRFHIPKSIAMSIAIEAAELMEHFQWCSLAESQDYVAVPENRQAVAEEMADVLIYLLSLAHHSGIDLSQAVVDKMARNEERFPVERYRQLSSQ